MPIISHFLLLFSTFLTFPHHVRTMFCDYRSNFIYTSFHITFTRNHLLPIIIQILQLYQSPTISQAISTFSQDKPPSFPLHMLKQNITSWFNVHTMLKSKFVITEKQTCNWWFQMSSKIGCSPEVPKDSL